MRLRRLRGPLTALLLLAATSALAAVGHGTADGCGRACGPERAGAGATVLAQASGIDARTIEAYGTVLGLGTRAGQLVPEITAIRDALARGDRARAASALGALYAKAGRLTPVGQAMDQLLNRLAAAGVISTPGPSLPQGGSAAPLVGASASGSAPTPSGGGTPAAASAGSGNGAGAGPSLPLGQSTASASSGSAPAGATATNPPPGGATAPSAAASGGNSGPPSAEPAKPAAEAAGGTALPPPEPGICGTGTGAAGCREGTPAMTSSDCEASGDTALTSVDDIVGVTWTNDQGEKITITGGPANLYWSGKHTWLGTSQAGRLHFTRYPEASEMGDAPQWAREAAAMSAAAPGAPTAPLGGQASPVAQPAPDQHVKWELELEARTECGQPVLVGKWYPGSFKWSENYDAAGAEIVASRKLTDIGRGKPIDVRYFRAQPAIVDVAVMERQTRDDELGLPFYRYPFQPGADDAGGALTNRTLYVYGVDLPRGSSFTLTSDDPAISYFVYAPQRHYEVNRLYTEPFQRGLSAAQAAHDWRYASEIANMDSLLLRARLARGVLPGIKSFRLNGVAASWELRFGDDVALISFARAADGSLAPPAELRPDEVELTQFLFKPERFFIEVRTRAPFPLKSLELRVGVDEQKVTWNGTRTIAATLVPGTTTIYRTPAIELVQPGRIWRNEPGSYFLPTDGGRIFAALENPWLLRHNPADARLLAGPGDLGHGFKYYLRRAAIADKVDPLPDLSTPDGWRQLSGHSAAKLYDVALLTGYAGGDRKPKTWKRWLVDWYLKVDHPLWYFAFHVDDVVLSTNVTVAEHAALLFFRDTFVDQMNAGIAQWQKLIDDYAADRDAAAMRGLRDYLRANAWNDDSIWRYVEVSCPGGSGGPSLTGLLVDGSLQSTCSVAYALSDSYLEKRFPNDRPAADRWSISATAQGVRTVLDAAREARDKASALDQADIRGLLKILGRNYEPLLPHLASRLMRQDESGKWVPDTAALYSLKELHQLTDAVVAQEELSRADKLAVLKLVLAPVVIMGAPVLIAEEAAAAAVNWGLYAKDAILDVAEEYWKLPDVRFALGASLALGAEQLSAAETERSNAYFKTVEKLAHSALLNVAGGEIVMPAVLHYGLSGAIIIGRPALAAIRRGGAAAFKKLSLKAQEAVLAMVLRGKSVQQEAALSYAGAFERDAVVAADKLAADAGAFTPHPAAPPAIAATGNPLAKAETASVRFTPAEEVEGEVVEIAPEEPGTGQAPGKAGASTVVLDAPSAGAAPADPSVLLARRWRGAPKANSRIRLMESPDAVPRDFDVGARLGEPGAYVWTLDLSAIDGQPSSSAIVLKLAGAGEARAAAGGGRDFFQGWEMVANSEAGYALVTQRTGIRVLHTEFHPHGMQVLPSGKLARMPFMVQEALGPRRRLLDDVLRRFGQDRVPEDLQQKIAALWGEFKRGGIYPQDMNWKNLWVELEDGSMSWESYYQTGGGSVEVGLLDFDRIVLWEDYINHRAGKMGQFLNWVELKAAPGKILSMAPVYGSEENSWLWAMKDLDINLYVNEHPGPYWTDELDYALEKQLEFHNYVSFDPASRRIVKYAIDPKYLRTHFPLLNDSSRFEPFLLARPGNGPASQRRLSPARQRRAGQAPQRRGRAVGRGMVAAPLLEAA
jgi:hypothetical protein